MKIENIGQLEVISQVEQRVFDILYDNNYGRRAVSDNLSRMDIDVSEKLIRTWRERRMNEEQPVKSVTTIPFSIKTNPDDIIPKDPHRWNTTSDKLITGSTRRPSHIRAVSAPSLISGTGSKRVIAFGDFQINKHDPAFMEKTVRLLKDQQPDIICLTGDESDNSAVGRWAKGMREEFESNLQEQIDETVGWLEEIRNAAPNAQMMMADSNHMQWITKAIQTRLPGFATLRALTPEVLYQLNDFDISYERKLVEFLPDYILGHGHQWQLSSASHSVKGPEHVMRTGKSILAGHTHQSILRPVFIGFNGKGKQLVYANPGCMMDFEKAMASNGGYLSGTSPNWSKGIVVITREAGNNYTELILGENDGSFRYEGTIY